MELFYWCLKRRQIAIDDFDKIQLRIGEILKCEEVPKSKKLLCSQVKIGSEVKQIVSGIKMQYSAEEMVGKKVVVVNSEFYRNFTIQV